MMVSLLVNYGGLGDFWREQKGFLVITSISWLGISYVYLPELGIGYLYLPESILIFLLKKKTKTKTVFTSCPDCCTAWSKVSHSIFSLSAQLREVQRARHLGLGE